MINPTATQDHIEQVTRNLLRLLAIRPNKLTCQARVVPDKDGVERLHVLVDLEVSESARLAIGARGNHLLALQHLLRCMTNSQLTAPCHIMVDVNNYLAMRAQTTINLAKEAARKVGRTRHAVALPPMSAAQRHTVHSSLASRPDIQTESLGKEPNRRIIIRPVF